MTAWDPGRRSRVWALANPETLEKLADAGLAGEGKVRVLQEPATALMMMEATDPVSGGSFYAGEVLVTSCQVEVGGKVGCVIVVGDEPERARAAAILDALLQEPSPRIAPLVNELLVNELLVNELENEEKRIDAGQRAEWALASRTKVKFETMEDRPYAAPRS